MIIRRASQLAVGDSYKARKTITQAMVDQFVSLIGDNNPIHSLDNKIPEGSEQRIAEDHRVPGALLNGLVSGLIGSHFPGSGSLVVGQEYAFPNKCVIDRPIDFHLQLVQNRKIIKIAYECKQNEVVVCQGVAKIMPINRSQKESK